MTATGNGGGGGRGRGEWVRRALVEVSGSGRVTVRPHLPPLTTQWQRSQPLAKPLPVAQCQPTKMRRWQQSLPPTRPPQVAKCQPTMRRWQRSLPPMRPPQVAKCWPTRTRQWQRSLHPTRPLQVAECQPTRTSHWCAKFLFLLGRGESLAFFWLLIVQCYFVCISPTAMGATQGRCEWKNASWQGNDNKASMWGQSLCWWQGACRCGWRGHRGATWGWPIKEDAQEVQMLWADYKRCTKL